MDVGAAKPLGSTDLKAATDSTRSGLDRGRQDDRPLTTSKRVLVGSAGDDRNALESPRDVAFCASSSSLPLHGNPRPESCEVAGILPSIRIQGRSERNDGARREVDPPRVSGVPTSPRAQLLSSTKPILRTVETRVRVRSLRLLRPRSQGVGEGRS